jgi:septal ring factor EnvC (AmiA/AmiB activator)
MAAMTARERRHKALHMGEVESNGRLIQQIQHMKSDLAKANDKLRKARDQVSVLERKITDLKSGFTVYTGELCEITQYKAVSRAPVPIYFQLGTHD